MPERSLLASLTAVAFPAFSAQVREGRSLKAAYLRAIEYIIAFHWPALILLAIFAHPIVHILLGHQWMAIVPLVQIISVALLAWFPAYLTYPTLVASGGIRDTLTSSLISAALSAAGPSLLVVMLGQPTENSIALAIVGLVIAGIGWLAGLRVTCHPLMGEISSLWHKLREAPKYRGIVDGCVGVLHRFSSTAARDQQL